MNEDEIEISHYDHAVQLRSWEDPEADNGKGVRATKELSVWDTIEEERTHISTPGEEGARPNEKKKQCLSRRFLSCSAILVVIVGGVVAFVTLWQTGVLAHEVNLTSTVSSSTGDSKLPLCNGLASNCGWSVNEIMFAGVHNAMSSKSNGFAPWNNLLPLEDALNAGFRALFIDSCNCGVFGVTLCHEVCAAGYRKVIPAFTAILNFLSTNSNEVVILELQIGKDSFVELMNTVFEIPGFSDALYEHPGRGFKWPLMMDLINNNKRLIVFQHDGGGCDTDGQCPKGVHDTYVHAFETPFNSQGIDGLMNVTATCQITRGDHRNAFFISNHFAGNRLLLPEYDIAAEANSAQNLETRLDACEEMVGKRVNILVVDFWNIGDVLLVVNSYNQELGFASGMPSMGPSLEPSATRAPTMVPSYSSRPSDLHVSNWPSDRPTVSPFGQLSVPSGSPIETVSPFGQFFVPSSTPLETTSPIVSPSTESTTWSPVEAIPTMSSASSFVPTSTPAPTTSQTPTTIESSLPSNSPTSTTPPATIPQSNIFSLPTPAPSKPYSLGSNGDYVSPPPSQFGAPILAPTTFPSSTTTTPSILHTTSTLYPTIISRTSTPIGSMPASMEESLGRTDAPSPAVDLFDFNFVDLNP